MAGDTAVVHEGNSLVLDSSSWEDLLDILSKPDPLADLIIDVEGHQLHASKYLLASASPKFRQMFTDPAVDNTNILPLTGVSLRATVDLLRWLLPSQSFAIQEETMEVLLQLAFDYGIEELLKECDRYVTNKLEMSAKHEDCLQYLILAERFALTNSFGHAVDLLSRLTMEELTSLEHLDDMKSGSLCLIMRKHTKEFKPQNGSCGRGPFSETTALVVEDREIQVPTSALVAASDVFEAMITSDFLEHQMGRITLPGKLYDGVEFMVNYITSRDYVPIAGELLSECVGLAEEYILGRLKHACIEYMISSMEQADLNECLLYLRLAHKYRLSDVENKVLHKIHRRSTADIMACTNYDITFVAALLLRHAQWLEEELSKLTQIIERVKIDVSKFWERLLKATNEKQNQTDYCPSDSHTIYFGSYFRDSCHGCAFMSRKQFKGELNGKCDESIQPEPQALINSFFNECDTEFRKLQQTLAI